MIEVLAELEKTLSGLKDFQKATVASVMFSFSESGKQRVLVADEVGLGKTIVAKGVIAEMLKNNLRSQMNGVRRQPLRVTYICSNLTLANENRKKLAVFKDNQAKYVKEPSFSRLLETALIPIHADDGDEKYLEVCSLTPATSFNLTQGQGNWKERQIICAALIQHEELFEYQDQLSEFFRDGINNWPESHEFITEFAILEDIRNEFYRLLGQDVEPYELDKYGVERGPETWFAVILELCRSGFQFRESVPPSRLRTVFRSLLARSCAKHLSADLFILDEFQRFKVLLDSKEDNGESLVAREIFKDDNHSKILLLSATPFKALSRIEDDEEGNAHAEELNFLLNFISRSDQHVLSAYGAQRMAIQQQILSLRNKDFDLDSLKEEHKVAIEGILKKYLCRTERVQISEGYEELFSSTAETCLDYFTHKDIQVFKAIDQLGLGLKEAANSRLGGQLMEFYKAAPWPLSFLSGYQFKRQLDKYRTHKSVKKPLKGSNDAWLSRDQIQQYQLNLENAPHAKTRALIKKLFQTASEELLWVPPSIPHYPLEGSFKGQSAFSKSLLFSSWALVPRALSGLISYEAERRLLVNKRISEKAYFKDKERSVPISFDEKSSLVGWSLVYPSKVLVNMSLEAHTSSLDQLIAERTAIFQEQLEKFTGLQSGNRTGDLWFALAPFLIDIKSGHDDYVRRWLADPQLVVAAGKDDKEHKGRTYQLSKLGDYLKGDVMPDLGPMPAGLAEYLACLSIGGPAVAVARAWQNIWGTQPGRKISEAEISSAATAVAFSVIGMFNKVESESVLAKLYPKDNGKYFSKILRYCAEGDFQAVVEEYGHLLKDAGLPMISGHGSDCATGRLQDVLGFRTSSVACQFRDHKRQTSDQITSKASEANSKHTLRCHYAVPLGNQKVSDDAGLQRVSNVRDAFNSPFRPFVLNSTSIGQEGLDFHWYCRQVVHWNIPSNPIDIEQREGRVNRYKSLVVRRRIAEKFRDVVVISEGDTWSYLFAMVDKITKANGRYSDLVPYWHLPEGSSRIERYVPLMPMSKDVEKLDTALKILSLYRLAFGQPRQEELLENLLSREFSYGEIEKIKKKLMINLSPLSVDFQVEIKNSELKSA